MEYKFYAIDDTYIHSLRLCSNNVPMIYDKSKLKPYIKVCTINGFDYFVGISSRKPKYCDKNVHLGFDAFKIYNKQGKLLCVLNLNNAIPVPSTAAHRIKYSEIDKYRDFTSNEAKDKYISLLKEEMKIIKSKSYIISSRLNTVVKKAKNNTNSNLAKRCADFEALENNFIKVAVLASLDDVSVSHTVNRIAQAQNEESAVNGYSRYKDLPIEYKEKILKDVYIKKALLTKEERKGGATITLEETEKRLYENKNLVYKPLDNLNYDAKKILPNKLVGNTTLAALKRNGKVWFFQLDSKYTDAFTRCLQANNIKFSGVIDNAKSVTQYVIDFERRNVVNKLTQEMFNVSIMNTPPKPQISTPTLTI